MHHSDPKGELYLRPYSRVYLAEKWNVLGVPNVVVYHLPSRQILTYHARFDLLKDGKIESTWAKWSEGEKIEFGVTGKSSRPLSRRQFLDDLVPTRDRISVHRPRLCAPMDHQPRRRRIGVRHQRATGDRAGRDRHLDRVLLAKLSVRRRRTAAVSWAGPDGLSTRSVPAASDLATKSPFFPFFVVDIRDAACHSDRGR